MLKRIYIGLFVVSLLCASILPAASAAQAEGAPVPGAGTASISITEISSNLEEASLTWSLVDGADGYIIYQAAAGSGSYSRVRVVRDGQETSAVIGSLKPGASYNFKVRAYRVADGKKKAIVTSSGRKVKMELLQPAVSGASMPSKTSVRLTWNANPYADHYYVYRASSEDGKYKRIASVTAASCTDKNLEKASDYYYKIRAVRTINGTTYTSSLSLAFRLHVLDQVTITKAASISYDTIRLRWKAVEGADGYLIYRASAQAGPYTRIAKLSSSRLYYDDGNLTCGSSCWYKIAAYQTIFGKNYTAQCSKTVSAAPVPAAPSAAAEARNGNKVKLTWNQVPGADTYTVMRSTAKDGSYKEIASGIAGLSYVDKGLSANKVYYYKLCGFHGKTRGKTGSAVKAKTFHFTVSPDSIRLPAGLSMTLDAVSSGNEKITWTSADPALAKVSSSGKVTGVSEGITEVYAVSHGVTLTVTVHVTPRIPGIDVSHWQGEISWRKVAASGVRFAMLKATQGTNLQDDMFYDNYKGAKKAGLDVGCYYFSTAKTVDQARKEAAWCLSFIEGCTMDYPVVMDFESTAVLNATTIDERTKMILAARKVVEDAGYDFALYISENWLTDSVDNSSFEGMDIWLAHWGVPFHTYTGTGDVTMWQYSNTGSVPGIYGDVDLDYSFKDYH
ncbi:MAG: Ig-like domain-containing protein [Lachnospiraceae bacterium]|nr:Ig-like domain-containing protein [Lachnospiraceae bacterium]